MNVNLYLPDDLGKRAKDAELPLSRLLQVAVTTELGRRAAVSKTLAEPQTFELTLEDHDGHIYTGRVTGACIAESRHGEVSVFLTDDERVIVYEDDRRQYHVIDDVHNLRDWLTDDAAYCDALEALGETPIVDI
jgi:hypothetical protein